jgi:large subunit ribosomal protein L43
MSRRGVWQLQRIVFNYCNHSGSSRGAREFLFGATNTKSVRNTNDIVDSRNGPSYMESFVERHPQITISSQVKSGRHPWIEATYLNGRVRSVSMKNDDAAEILRQMMNLRSTVGRRTSTGSKSNRQVKQRIVTSQPSIQQKQEVVVGSG